MKEMINYTKSIIAKGKTLHYHKEHKKRAFKYLTALEKENGKLTLNQKKICVEYAKDVFGDKKYAPYLYVYTAYSKEFKEGWIPDNYYGEVVVPNLNGEYGTLCNRTAIITKLIKDPNTLDKCYFVNNLFYDTSNNLLSEENLKSCLFSESNNIVFKLESSRQGKGIYFFSKDNFDLDKVKKLGNGVFQDYINQHQFFNEFNNSSVATVRVTSVCNQKGEIEIRASYLRFARSSDTHVKSDSAIYIPIELPTGKLFEKAFYPNWSSIETLPDNDFEFSGKLIPSFDKCISEIKALHKRIPFVRCIGWDIIIDDNDKVRIIELNGGHNGIILNEAFQGPCFKGLGWENLPKPKIT